LEQAAQELAQVAHAVAQVQIQCFPVLLLTVAVVAVQTKTMAAEVLTVEMVVQAVVVDMFHLQQLDQVEQQLQDKETQAAQDCLAVAVVEQVQQDQLQQAAQKVKAA
jgi:hypothetical protein